MTTTFTNAFLLRRNDLPHYVQTCPPTGWSLFAHVFRLVGPLLCIALLPAYASAQNQTGFWNAGRIDADPAQVAWTLGYTYPVPAATADHFNGKADISLSLFPNPCMDEIHLADPRSALPKGAVHLRIINVRGQEVWSGEYDPFSAQTAIDVRDLPSGSYVLQVQHETHPLHQEYVFVKTTKSKD